MVSQYLPTLLDAAYGNNTISLSSTRLLSLLSRLGNLKEARPVFTNVNSLPLWTSLLLRLRDDRSARGMESKSHVVRLLALFVQDTIVLQYCLTHRVFPTLLAILPPPDITRYTSMEKTVVVSHATLWGNAIKCLILLGKSTVPENTLLQLYRTDYACERLVRLLIELPDGPARKNTAIVVSQLCRIPELKKILVQLRAVEILVQLGKAWGA